MKLKQYDLYFLQVLRNKINVVYNNYNLINEDGHYAEEMDSHQFWFGPGMIDPGI